MFLIERVIFCDKSIYLLIYIKKCVIFSNEKKQKQKTNKTKKKNNNSFLFMWTFIFIKLTRISSLRKQSEAGSPHSSTRI
jgi:hypothetical protein